MSILNIETQSLIAETARFYVSHQLCKLSADDSIPVEIISYDGMKRTLLEVSRTLSSAESLQFDKESAQYIIECFNNEWQKLISRRIFIKQQIQGRKQELAAVISCTTSHENLYAEIVSWINSKENDASYQTILLRERIAKDKILNDIKSSVDSWLKGIDFSRKILIDDLLDDGNSLIFRLKEGAQSSIYFKEVAEDLLDELEELPENEKLVEVGDGLTYLTGALLELKQINSLINRVKPILKKIVTEHLTLISVCDTRITELASEECQLLFRA